MSQFFQNPLFAVPALTGLTAFILFFFLSARQRTVRAFPPRQRVWLIIGLLIAIAAGEPYLSTPNRIRIIHVLDESDSMRSPASQRARAERFQQTLPSGAVHSVIADRKSVG